MQQCLAHRECSAEGLKGSDGNEFKARVLCEWMSTEMYLSLNIYEASPPKWPLNWNFNWNWKDECNATSASHL